MRRSSVQVRSSALERRAGNSAAFVVFTGCAEPSSQTIRNRVKAADEEEAGGKKEVDLQAELRELRALRAENAKLREEREILKSSGLVRQGERVRPEEGFAFMKVHQAEFSVVAMARVFGLSRSGYYASSRCPNAASVPRDVPRGFGLAIPW